MEDDAIISRGLCWLLRDHVGRLATCTTAAQAIDALQWRPNWVLLDLMLPDGAGERVLEVIHERAIPSRVIVMTGVGDPKRLDAVHRMGIDALLRKPVMSADLLAHMGLT